MAKRYLQAVRTAGGLWRNDSGIGTLEIVLIAAVLIMVAILFKDWIMDFIGDLMDSVEGEAEDIFK